MDFTKKIVWITGASSGIGEHLTYAFAEQNARLIISSRKEQELQRVKQNCSNKPDILILPLDVGDIHAVAIAAEKAIAHYGGIDILINNAGVSQRAEAAETKIEVDQMIINVNFLGTVALTKAVLPTLQRQKSGQIVVMSSVLGKIGTPLRSAYSASKHALHGFFDSLRAEVAKDNIVVTIICPGYVHTNVTINALKGDGSKNNEMAESTRNGLEPAEFAHKALRAIYQQKEEILIAGPREAFGVYLQRFFPRIFSKVVRNTKVT